MVAVTNNHSISLPIAVWLLDDDYDYTMAQKYQNYISVTSLLKSPRQYILTQRAKNDKDNILSMDLSELVAARMGQAIHTAIEHSWRSTKRDQLLRKAGYPQSVIDRILVDPKPEDLKPDSIPVYFENRNVMEIGGWIVGGQYDAVFDGILTDYKTTSTYALTKGTNDEKYILQGSAYRLLNPEIITEDYMHIEFLFKDWSRKRAYSDKSYPQTASHTKVFELMSATDTRNFIINKLRLIKSLLDAPEEELDPCSSDDLWRDPPVFKVYKSELEMKRALPGASNFETRGDADTWRINNLGKYPNAHVHAVLSKAKACKYCSGASLCSQFQELVESGDVDLD